MNKASNCCIVGKHSLLKGLIGRGGAVLCCQTTVQMTATHATGTHSLKHTAQTALLRIPKDISNLIYFTLLFCIVCAEKALFYK